MADRTGTGTRHVHGAVNRNESPNLYESNIYFWNINRIKRIAEFF